MTTTTTDIDCVRLAAQAAAKASKLARELYERGALADAAWMQQVAARHYALTRELMDIRAGRVAL